MSKSVYVIYFSLPIIVIVRNNYNWLRSCRRRWSTLAQSPTTAY